MERSCRVVEDGHRIAKSDPIHLETQLTVAIPDCNVIVTVARRDMYVSIREWSFNQHFQFNTVCE